MGNSAVSFIQSVHIVDHFYGIRAINYPCKNCTTAGFYLPLPSYKRQSMNPFIFIIEPLSYKTPIDNTHRTFNKVELIIQILHVLIIVKYPVSIHWSNYSAQKVSSFSTDAKQILICTSRWQKMNKFPNKGHHMFILQWCWCFSSISSYSGSFIWHQGNQ